MGGHGERRRGRGCTVPRASSERSAERSLAPTFDTLERKKKKKEEEEKEEEEKKKKRRRRKMLPSPRNKEGKEMPIPTWLLQMRGPFEKSPTRKSLQSLYNNTDIYHLPEREKEKRMAGRAVTLMVNGRRLLLQGAETDRSLLDLLRSPGPSFPSSQISNIFLYIVFNMKISFL